MRPSAALVRVPVETTRPEVRSERDEPRRMVPWLATPGAMKAARPDGTSARHMEQNPVAAFAIDEPTSDLDPEAERVVVRALRTLMERRTVVIVTHRPALLELADRVLTVLDGRIRELPAASGWMLRGEAQPLGLRPPGRG